MTAKNFTQLLRGTHLGKRDILKWLYPELELPIHWQIEFRFISFQMAEISEEQKKDILGSLLDRNFSSHIIEKLKLVINYQYMMNKLETALLCYFFLTI